MTLGREEAERLLEGGGDGACHSLSSFLATSPPSFSPLTCVNDFTGTGQGDPLWVMRLLEVFKCVNLT